MGTTYLCAPTIHLSNLTVHDLKWFVLILIVGVPGWAKEVRGSLKIHSTAVISSSTDAIRQEEKVRKEEAIYKVSCLGDWYTGLVKKKGNWDQRQMTVTINASKNLNDFNTYSEESEYFSLNNKGQFFKCYLRYFSCAENIYSSYITAYINCSCSFTVL